MDTIEIQILNRTSLAYCIAASFPGYLLITRFPSMFSEVSEKGIESILLLVGLIMYFLILVIYAILHLRRNLIVEWDARRLRVSERKKRRVERIYGDLKVRQDLIDFHITVGRQKFRLRKSVTPQSLVNRLQDVIHSEQVAAGNYPPSGPL